MWAGHLVPGEDRARVGFVLSPAQLARELHEAALGLIAQPALELVAKPGQARAHELHDRAA
jgi:hypothetical protein